MRFGRMCHPASRLVHVCDVFDALISERPYKHAWTIDEALAEIAAESGTHFDPQVVVTFFEHFDELRAVIDETNGATRR